MQVLYLHQYYNNKEMVGGTRSYYIARGLVERGHQVNLLTTHRGDKGTSKRKWQLSNDNGIHVHWYPVPYSNKFPYWKRIIAFLKFSAVSIFKAMTLDCDIIYATSTPLTIAIPGIIISRLKKIPLVFEVRDLWPEIPIAIGAIKNPVLIWLSKSLERQAYKNSEKLIALSPGMKEGIIRRGCPENKIEVIPNFCDIEAFEYNYRDENRIRSKYSWLGDRPLVIYAGSIGYINGLDYLVRLAEEIYEMDSDIRFVVIGDGKEKEKNKKMASLKGILEKNYFVIDPLPKKEISAWFSAADMSISLFINIEEMWNNSANKFFDSLAAGVPIAINYKGWQEKIIKENDIGIVLDPENIKEAAESLAKVLRQKEWLKSAGERARKVGMENFEKNKMIDKIEAILKEVVKGNKDKGKVVRA